jgi:hypothetical protein
VNDPAPVPPSAIAMGAARLDTVPPVMFAYSVAALATVNEPVASVFDVGSVTNPLNRKKLPAACLTRP